MPEKPHNFWQELKRRKVFKVIAMYAAAAYVIIELSNNIAEPLRLPEWVPTFIIILLVAGFPFAVIFSWIFDITPKGIQKTKPAKAAREDETVLKPDKRKLRVSDIVIAVLLVAVIVLVYPKIFKPDRLEQLRSQDEITIAILPFQNHTSDTSKDFWQGMLQDNIINTLSNSRDLKVRQNESVSNLLENNDIDNYSNLTPSLSKLILKGLEVNVYVQGSFSQVGELIRLNAKLIDTGTDEIFQSFTLDGSPDKVLLLADSLSSMIRDFLIIKVLGKEVNPDFQSFFSTKSPEAYRYYILADRAFTGGDLNSATDLLSKAVATDSDFIVAAIQLGVVYSHTDRKDLRDKWFFFASENKDKLSLQQKTYLDYILSTDPLERINCLRQFIEIDDQAAFAYYQMGMEYFRIKQYENAIPQLEKAIFIYRRWGMRPRWITNYLLLGEAYHKLGRYEKEKKVYKMAEKDFPENSGIKYRQIVLALAKDNTRQADDLFNKYKSIRRMNNASDAIIYNEIANIYAESSIPDRAEEYFQKALNLEPESPNILYDYAWFLVDTERNIKKGLEMIEKAHGCDLDDHSYLHCKGWGLYKQGNYREALNILQESWDLRMENVGLYDHEAFLHLEEARKAVANQKIE